ncbi:eukaryotic translation initiation factor 2-alpha kinase [Recurvomyces mirabilis]|uniref:non-specific serine/threonine protein kinase n=1 Tax=Recurvomyces mirabilis TaxID=574656 RepID=A0AAE0WKW8_9PEZI|nr:eukaryotic translation initiation factor 2-alpha kinase [Recurvomyces mirabilis]KAK5151084.1 eukaryotic translation initiation factor 2-alpha kinase [Recurvomyces mirabilis]
MAPKTPKKINNAKATGPRVLTEQTATATINYGEVQDEEIEVLKAIYMDDYEDVEIKGAWSKTTDRSFRLRLRAFSDQESSMLLAVRLTATYPKSAPLLETSGLQGYHERTQRRISNIITLRPKQLLGEVMIHAIASEIQDALEDAVTARQQGTLPSLEEERASAEEVASTLAFKAEAAESKRLLEAQEEEDRVLKQMVDEELMRREKRRSTKITAPISSTSGEASKVMSFDQPATLVDSGRTIEFTDVELVTLLESTRTDELHLGKPRLHATIAPQLLVAVKRLMSDKDRDDILEIERYLETVRQLRHSSILGLLTYRIDRLDSTKIQFSLCSEYADRGTLQELLTLGTMQQSKARQHTTSLLEALDYLHSRGVTHGALTCRSIFVQSSPSVALKLGRLGQWRLQSSFEDDLPEKWRSAEKDRRADIWQLGVVVLQMFFGVDVVEEYTSPHDMIAQLDLSDTFRDFLVKMFDSTKRLSAFDLLPAEFLRTDFDILREKTSMPLKGQRRRPSSSLGVVTHRRLRTESSNALEPVGMSRYLMDFTELGRLGKGGFGEVVKARNKLDGGVYAIKKIKQAPHLLDQVLSEVMLLNRLNHPYVVRYFATWLENDVLNVETDETTTATTESVIDESNDSSSDGPRMDFGYQSTGGLDFVSSSGYAQIEFGDDDDDEADGDGTASGTDNTADDVPPKGTSSSVLELRKTHTQPPRLPSMLYIQMEYCERHTLRDLVRKGMSEDEAWRYVRQITEGLAHIHSHGIIHRDLKPDNVFLDVAENPKIGDFGLATTTQYQTERASVMSGSAGGDMTRSVGTAMYVAPELRTNSGGSYNAKVDMYSLGIMFYEMCEEFSTAMERIRALQQVREKEHELPPAYRTNGAKVAQGKLITCLISHKPSERPSSTELLRSDILPVKVEDETIRQALSGLTDSRSPYHQKMMSALFAHDPQGTDRVKSLAWDAQPQITAPDATRLRNRSIALCTLEQIFRRHGAEETRRETIFPRSSYYQNNTNVVQMLDASGLLLQLPYDLTLPYARQLARQAPPVKRTFVFGSAYRDAYTGGAPKVNDEVDFDITSTNPSLDGALDEAEMLKVMDEIFCELPSFSKATVSLHFNHTLVLDTILEHCRVPLAQQPMVREAISRLGFHGFTWAKVRTELRKSGLADTMLDDMQLFDFRETPEKALPRLRGLLEPASTRLKTKLEQGLRSLQDILDVLSAMTLHRKLYVVPLGSVNAKLFEGGMLFQCVLERKTNRAVLAAGGRYDSLIRAHRVTGTFGKGCEGAVGVSIGLDSLVAHMIKPIGSTGKKAFLKNIEEVDDDANLAKRCDILVETSSTDGALVAGLRILNTLWANDISAELATAASKTSEHNLIVSVRHEASHSVRIRSAASDSDEVDVPLVSLVSHLQSELREKETTTNKVRPPAFTRHSSHHESADRRGNVQVLMAQHRSKKSNKYHIVEAAQTRWAEKMDEWKDAPILAIETSDGVLESIKETRLSEAESWRRSVQSVQLNERQYLGQVQDILASWRKKWMEGDGGREACVFNFRTGSCIYYDVGS